MHSIKTLEFRSPINRDHQISGVERLADDVRSEMELYVLDEANRMFIEWVIDPPVDEVEHIGIWLGPVVADAENWWNNGTGKYELIDYDGVFELPPQAIELLESVGITVPEEFRPHE